MLRLNDFTELQYQRQFPGVSGYDIQHKQEFDIGKHKMRMGINKQVENSSNKYHSTERKIGFSLEHDSIPAIMKLIYSIRSNKFDKYASIEAFKNDLLSTSKTSFILETINYWERSFLRTISELGIPHNASMFLKQTIEAATYCPLFNDKCRISYNLTAGMIKPLTNNKPRIDINDRFFLNKEYGFNHVSQTTPSSYLPCNCFITVDASGNEAVIGDDLGVEKMLTQTLRFSWMNIPFLNSINCAPLIYGHMSYYPKENKSSLSKSLRISTGIGASFSIGMDLNFMFYYNFGNPISQEGDLAKKRLGICITMF